MGQYLSAVFELRPTRRKAAALERVRAAAETVFWSTVADRKPKADAVAAISDGKERRTAWRTWEAELARIVIASGAKAALAEPVVQGLVRDVQMAISSYVEKRSAGHEAGWPAPAEATAVDHAAALRQLLTATSREHENAAKDALAAVAHPPGPRPLIVARSRDGMLVRTGADRAIAVILNLFRATDSGARAATLKPGIDATTGEAFKGGTSKTKIIVPLACSKWHEQKFLSGRAVLRSSLVRRVGERWFMCAQFEFPEKHIRVTGARVGVDRGIVNPVAVAAVDRTGAVQSVVPPAGKEIGQIIRRADERRRREQKRRGISSHRHAEALDQQLHLLANGIVAEAKQRGAHVVIEKLDGFKQAITAVRPKGTRKGGWRRTLKRAQLGKLERILTYKLALAGLPKLREVVAGGTSVTCPACGLRDPKSRPAQDRFVCTGCGFKAHADSIGAINIARRGVAMEQITKGAKLAPIEQDMVARLRSRDDGGLGPLVARKAEHSARPSRFAASGFVAARASAASAKAALPGCIPGAGQDSQLGVQNAGNSVFAARGAHFPHAQPAKKEASSTASSPSGSAGAVDVG